MSLLGQSPPNCAIPDMSVRHPIADMRADIARRRFVVNRVASTLSATSPLIPHCGSQDAINRRQRRAKAGH